MCVWARLGDVFIFVSGTEENDETICSWESAARILMRAVMETLRCISEAFKLVIGKPVSEQNIFENYAKFALVVDEIVNQVCTRSVRSGAHRPQDFLEHIDPEIVSQKVGVKWAAE